MAGKSVPLIEGNSQVRESQSEKMAQIETLGILEEIEALVSVQLQVVSYKWLSRTFLVSSNAAKRLLKEFVEKHGSRLEVVYALSGWLKDSSMSYHIRLVSGTKLTEAKQDFDGNCSVQVYSVQASIPKDPAAIWNAEFVQAEELFRQPSTVDNCFRDNRFCVISNSLVKRNVDGSSVSIAAGQPKSVGISGSSKNNFTHQNNTVSPPQQNKVKQSSLKVGLQSAVVAENVRSETNGTSVHDQSTKPSVDKEKFPPVPANRKKGQNDKRSSGAGGSLANLWGRASTNSKPNCAPADDDNSIINPTGNADSQIQSREAVDSGGSDDDAQDVNLRRGSDGEGSRKRRVVFDYSDEEEYEDAVSLASPEVPKGQSNLDAKRTPKSLISEKPNKEKESKPKVKEENATSRESNQSLREAFAIVSKNVNTEISSSEKKQNCAPEIDVNKKVKATDAAPNSPKRRKVLQTRIDERGREVTEIVWEGEETDKKKVESDATKKVDHNTAKKTDNQTGTNAVSRLQVAKKSPAVGSTAPSNAGVKAGNKKAGNMKDPKQGDILSFFKRV